MTAQLIAKPPFEIEPNELATGSCASNWRAHPAVLLQEDANRSHDLLARELAVWLAAQPATQQRNEPAALRNSEKQPINSWETVEQQLRKS